MFGHSNRFLSLFNIINNTPSSCLSSILVWFVSTDSSQRCRFLTIMTRARTWCLTFNPHVQKKRIPFSNSELFVVLSPNIIPFTLASSGISILVSAYVSASSQPLFNLFGWRLSRNPIPGLSYSSLLPQPSGKESSKSQTCPLICLLKLSHFLLFRPFW